MLNPHTSFLKHTAYYPEPSSVDYWLLTEFKLFHFITVR